MITEFVVAAAITFTGRRIIYHKEYEIKKIFKEIMDNNNLEYKIIEIREYEYGYCIIVSLYGCGFEKLEESKDLIETSLGSSIEIVQNANLKTATIYVLREKLTDDYPYKPIKVKSYELYIGKTYTMQDIILSMKELPHCLYSGINSSGKTYCLITSLVNLLYWNNEKEIELFLSQVSSKKDLRKFKDVNQCRGYAENLQQAFDLFSYLYHVMNKRISMFNSIKNQFIDDVYEWNKAFPSRKMRIIYLAMDEFTSYMPDSLDSKDEALLKQRCLDLLLKLIQQSRCTGIYILTSLQRPDKESLPPRLKAQFNCKVSFKQSNIASSLVVTDSDKAFNIKPKREAIVNADDEYLIKTLYIDNSMIKELLADKLDLEHKNYYNYKKIEAATTGNKGTGKNKNKAKLK